jgi:hypothetical protein
MIVTGARPLNQGYDADKLYLTLSRGIWQEDRVMDTI